MVTLRGLAQRARLGLNAPTDLVRGAFTPTAPPEPGLATYRIPLDGGQMRLHLRVEQDGSGVLFRDVTEVVHLNATATEMAKMALDGVPLTRAAASHPCPHPRRYPWTDRRASRGHLPPGRGDAQPRRKLPHLRPARPTARRPV